MIVQGLVVDGGIVKNIWSSDVELIIAVLRYPTRMASALEYKDGDSLDGISNLF